MAAETEKTSVALILQQSHVTQRVTESSLSLTGRAGENSHVLVRVSKYSELKPDQPVTHEG